MRLGRRDFLKLSASSLAGVSLGCRNQPALFRDPDDYEVVLVDDLLAGHRLFEGDRPRPATKKQRCEIAVVGAGISGLAAATQLKDRDVRVFELGKQPGGTSAFGKEGPFTFAYGAHYDLEYPATFGQEVLEFLARLQIIAFNPLRDMWTFWDTQYIIPPDRESRCLENGRFRDDVFPDVPQTPFFRELSHAFHGKMPLPTRLIDPSLHYLDSMTFLQWLQESRLADEPRFLRALDYQMKDDYGAGVDRISALAGIHYFQCRPYFTEPVLTFSPPNGNGYFVEKMLAALGSERVQTRSLVMGIRPLSSGFEVSVLRVESGELETWTADEVIYAGQKQGLKRLNPAWFERFAHVRYAPWVVLNLCYSGTPADNVFWQNEVLSEDTAFLGVVDGAAQYGKRGSGEDGSGIRRCLTAYLCLDEGDREQLKAWLHNPKPLIDRVRAHVAQLYGENGLGHLLKVHVKPHGHAMPIPEPGYLFRNNDGASGVASLSFAGVDCGRLPLIFEALDSGILAALNR